MKAVMKVLSYRILLRPEPEGGFTVLAPALPGCVSYGRTLAQAKAMASDAINAYLESLRKHNEPIPDDTGVLEEMVTVRCA